MQSALPDDESWFLVVEDVVPDSPAAKVGLQVGDRLLSYDGMPLPSPAALQAVEENTFGKTEVTLVVQRGNKTLTLTVPLGKLGIQVRPELPPAALTLYEEGRAALQAQQTDEAIARWTEAAKAAQEAGDNAAAVWLYGRVGEIFEKERRWQEALEVHAAAWELLKALTPSPSPTMGRGVQMDAAAQSHTLKALERCSQNLNNFLEAQRWYELAWQVNAAAGNEMWAATDLNHLGDVAFFRGDLPAAHGCHTRALAIHERLAPNSLTVAQSLNNLGNVVSERDNLPEAHDYYTRALAIREQLVPNSLDVAESLTGLGNVALDRGELQAAHDFYTRALAIRERLAPTSLAAAQSLNNLGDVAWFRGELQAAHDYYTYALAICEQLAPNSLDVAQSLNNLGKAAWSRGDLSASHDYHIRALAIRQRLSPNSLAVAASLNNLGTIAYDRGELQAADDYHTRALAIYERLAPNSLDVAMCLTNLGNVAWSRGDLPAAHNYYTRALAIYERLAPNSLDVAMNLNNLGNVALACDELQAADDYHTRALAIYERLAPNSLDVAMSLNNLGNVALARDELQAAKDYLTRALAIYERLAPNFLAVAECLTNLGRVAADRGELQVAYDDHIRALMIREHLAPNSLAVAQSLNNLGDLALDERRFSDALSLFTRAVEIVETQRRQIASTEARALLVAQHTMPYTGLLRTSLALNDPPAAFATLERARARSLVERLAERQLDFRADAPADLLAQQNELDQKRSFASTQLTQLDPNRDSSRIEELRAQLARYDVQQRELETQIRRASPKFAALQYPEPLDLVGAQAALDAGTLLLTYYVDEKATSLFAVTKTGLEVFTLLVGEDALKKQVRALQNAVTQKRLGNPLQEAHEHGRELYEALIRPAQAQVNQAQRILLCPDGPLHTTPFAALVSQTEPLLRYFVEEKPLHTIFSMTVYAETRKGGSGRTRETRNTKRFPRLLAFGDPIYTREQAEAMQRQKPLLMAQGREDAPPPPILGEIATGKEATQSDPEIVYLRGRGLKLNPLPGTRKEVEGIARLFGKSARTKLGQEATETAAKRESQDADLLHFACHGWLDEQMGLSSALALSQPEALGLEAKEDDNGLLQAWEILEQVRLKADLVVLSACQTGLGQEVRGEGLIGLTRAFLYAGANSVVASLWEVSDASTAALMRAFYQHLRKGASKDVALQKAMATVRRNPKYQHPFYWSPFILVGDWQ
ncbi:tetratricopeptide repeat protein [Candidatus Poribacteria bacterium]|nr:tetratricopeptide repeat protein [Candidatus Poribacteria bacterium]